MKSLRCVGTALLALTIAVGSGAAGDALASDRVVADVGGLDAVSCPSVTTCFAVGGPHVLATSDSGLTWTEATTPPSVERLYAVSCWSTRRCEVAGTGFGDAGAVYGTVDGGLTWRHQPAELIGGVFLAISCASRSFCVTTGNEGMLAVTTDGGRTWDGQRVEGVSLINAVDCLSTTVCEAVGYNGGAGSRGVALRTGDGGQHWDVTPLPSIMSFAEAVACPSLDTCVTVGMDTVQSGSKQLGRIVVTTNSGASWQRKRVPAGYTNLSGVACPTVDVCIAAGYGPRGMVGTVDGGTTWTPQGPRTVIPHGIGCASGSTCTAVGQTRGGRAAIYRTDDSGRTWQRQSVG